MSTKNLFIIAGCNGAGKTTASFYILPKILECKEFVNADEIARGISPFQPEKVAIDAGRIMLNRINELFQNQERFAIETTLATKIYKRKIVQAQSMGYKVYLLFFSLESVELAKDRVRIRVAEGGHSISDEVIERRFFLGLKALFDDYLDIVDFLMLFDNSEGLNELIANKEKGLPLVVVNQTKFSEIVSHYERQQTQK